MDEDMQIQMLADLFGLEDIEMEDLLIEAGIDVDDLIF